MNDKGKVMNVVYRMYDVGFTLDITDYDEYQEYINDPIMSEIPLTVEVLVDGKTVRVEIYNENGCKKQIIHY